MASPSSWLDSGAVSKLRDFTEKLLIMSNKNNNNLENRIQIENMVSSQLLLGGRQQLWLLNDHPNDKILTKINTQ